MNGIYVLSGSWWSENAIIKQMMNVKKQIIEPITGK